MKRKYILSGLLACALTFSACDVDLLDIPQKGVENEENYYQTDEQCESCPLHLGDRVRVNGGKLVEIGRASCRERV